MEELTDLRERVARLEAANTDLAAQLAALRDAVERARIGGYRSIRDSRRCPACGGGAFLHVPRATQVSHTRIVPLGITHEWKWTGAIAHGALESFTCRRCGLVELHVTDFSDVQVDGQSVIALDPEPDPPRDGPFR
jgi:hypothetical protein